MSVAVDAPPALIGVLAERCRASAGGQTSITVRRLLAAYGAERRGRHVLARIQQDLAAVGLSCRLTADEPEFVDDSLDIRLREPGGQPALQAAAPVPAGLVIVEAHGRSQAGVVIDARGLVVTSALLVADAVAWGLRSVVSVRTVGGAAQRWAGCVAATDRDSDIALIWIAADGGLPAVSLQPLLEQQIIVRAEITSAARDSIIRYAACNAQPFAHTVVGRRIRCDIPIERSGLGGPVLVNGAVVAILNRRGSAHCFGVPISTIGLLREQAELQRQYCLSRLRCTGCGAWRTAGVDGLQPCAQCGRTIDDVQCAACGQLPALSDAHECCTACGQQLTLDDDGLTQLACTHCRIELDSVEHRCSACVGLAAGV